MNIPELKQGEEIKPIEGFDGYYITNQGRVWSTLKQNTGKWLKPNPDGRYVYVSLQKNNKRHCSKIHRLVALAFINNPNNKQTVNHIDGNRINNHYSNLEWMSQKENVRHSWNNNLSKPHAVHGRMITPLEIIEIDRLYKIGIRQNNIAKYVDISPSIVQKVIARTGRFGGIPK